MTTIRDAGAGSLERKDPRPIRAQAPLGFISKAENRGNSMNTKSSGHHKAPLLAYLTAFLLLISLAPRARADESTHPDGPEAGDPPSRVARISFLDGSVSFQPGGTGDWGAAA